MKYDEKGNFLPMSDKQIVRKVWIWVIIGVLGVTVFSLVGWQVGWWFKKENTERQIDIDVKNKGAQMAWQDEAMSGISDFYKLDDNDTARRGAIRAQTCQVIGHLTDNYRNQTIDQFEAQEC